jgi:hypothetical protein
VAAGLLVLILAGRADQGEDLTPSLALLPSPTSQPTPSGSIAATEGASPAPTEPPPTLLAVGDIGSCESQFDDAVARRAAALPGQVALLGDIAYDDGSPQDFANCFDPAWGRLRDRLRPAPGNHDYHTPGASGYFEYFGRAAGPAGQGWYSYEVGSWHVISLNSVCEAVGCDRGSPQYEWLAADLRDHPADCTLAYWHHPRYSSGKHGDNDFVDPLYDLLVQADADILLAGHDHSYERQARDGLREFIVGTGGRSVYEFPVAPDAGTEVRAANLFGLLRITLRDGGYDWAYVPVTQTDFTDRGSGECD